MKQVLITGGAGFIGANLANHYLADGGTRVVIYDHLQRRGCLENVQWLQQNPRSEHLVVLAGDVRLPSPALRDEIAKSDAVFHLASQVAVTTSVIDPRYDFQVNAEGTFNILECVRQSEGKKPILFLSSTNKVYGGMEDIAVVENEDRFSYRDLPEGIPEDRMLDFHSPYGCSKGAADQYVRDYARIYGLQTVVFRQSCIYGSRQFGLEDQGWVAWFIIAAVLGRPITVYGNGKQVRDVLFVDDLVEAFDKAWDAIGMTSGKVYNVGGGPANTISLLDLLKLLREEIDPDLTHAWDDWRPGDQPVYVSDIRKAKRDFDWQPTTDWRTGVMRLIDWVKSNKGMLDRMF